MNLCYAPLLHVYFEMQLLLTNGFSVIIRLQQILGSFWSLLPNLTKYQNSNIRICHDPCLFIERPAKWRHEKQGMLMLWGYVESNFCHRWALLCRCEHKHSAFLGEKCGWRVIFHGNVEYTVLLIAALSSVKSYILGQNLSMLKIKSLVSSQCWRWHRSVMLT